MMSSTSPPPEAQRYGRSQTPESPRPVHVPEPSNIPVLLNQMDPVFNDTATYNIPNVQTFSPLADYSTEGRIPSASSAEHDAVQNFFREAENQAAAEPIVKDVQSDLPETSSINQATSFLTVAPVEDHLISQASHEPDLSIAQSRVENAQNESRTTMSQAAVQAASNINDGESASHNQAIDSIEENVSGEPLQPGPTAPKSTDLDFKQGVDYQSLLDTITQSASTAPAVSALTIPTTTASEAQLEPAALTVIPGLPPKPPPQETPLEFPTYSYVDNNQQQSVVTFPHAIATQQHAGFVPPSGTVTDQLLSQDDNLDATQVLSEQANALNGFGQAIASQISSALAPGQAPSTQSLPSVEPPRNQDLMERPWSPRTQIQYDQFLEEERRYVTEGIWDKFSNGSRLFVGNLPSEKVTKRDLFHRFYRHGKLAQISIKQAYGFVQFLEASSCAQALNAEQGVEIRGRKVHLEISKPQKNTRGAGSKTNQSQARRRSRSPDRNNRRSFNESRDEPGRRQNDYRNRRSPSPRGYRARDDYRPGARDGRSRSPIYPGGFGSASGPFDDEASLPLPRRDPRSVPDVQLLVLESDIVQSFINWVEQGFRMKGLQASTIWLNPRLQLGAVIKRQIIEGVQAVVKLTRLAQNNSKIPLQVFDRSSGASNVNFSEYVDLDLSIAADVVLQARMKERSPQPFRPPVYASQPSYQPSASYTQGPSMTHYPPPVPIHFQQQQQQQQQQPPLALPQSSQQYPFATQSSGYRPPSQMSGSPTSQPPNLQQLLANLRQPAVQTSPGGHVGASVGQPPHPQGPPTHQYGQYGTTPTQGYTGAIPQQGHTPANMQNIMEQLARYQR